MQLAFDAIIIGAGPAGSTAAILLARHGWRVALVEKRHFPRRKVCGECIAASNLPLLAQLGIGNAFCRLAGPPLRQVALIIGQQMVRADLPRYADSQYPWGAALGREHLDSLLLRQALREGAQVYQPWTARSITGSPGAYHCIMQSLQDHAEQVLAAPVLIDAHGSWESLPMAGSRQAVAHCPTDLLAFKANFTGADLEPGLLPVLSFPGGYGGMVIGDHRQATLAFCIRRDVLASSRKNAPDHSKAAHAAQAYVAKHCMHVQKMMAGASQCGPWLGAGPVRPGIRILQQAQQAFLIGNAAGEAHPIIGEGISMAIQSAWLLANTLGADRSRAGDRHLQARWRQQYASAWQRQFAARIRLAALFAHAAMHPALSSKLMPLLQRYPALLSHFARWSGKVRKMPGNTGGTIELLNINNPPV